MTSFIIESVVVILVMLGAMYAFFPKRPRLPLPKLPVIVPYFRRFEQLKLWRARHRPKFIKIWRCWTGRHNPPLKYAFEDPSIIRFEELSIIRIGGPCEINDDSKPRGVCIIGRIVNPDHQVHLNPKLGIKAPPAITPEELPELLDKLGLTLIPPDAGKN